DVIGQIGRGHLSELRIGSVPSIAQVMVPRAVERIRKRYPDLKMDINILKLEEVIDYLLLGKGDCAAISYRLDHPALDFLPLPPRSPRGWLTPRWIPCRWPPAACSASCRRITRSPVASGSRPPK